MKEKILKELFLEQISNKDLEKIENKWLKIITKNKGKVYYFSEEQNRELSFDFFPTFIGYYSFEKNLKGKELLISLNELLNIAP